MILRHRHLYADAWPWTVRTVGARVMFLAAVATAVYVTYVLFGSYAETGSTHGLADAFARWIAPALAIGAAALAVGLALTVYGRRGGR